MFNRFRNKMKEPEANKEARRLAVRRQTLIARRVDLIKNKREIAQIAKDNKDAADKV